MNAPVSPSKRFRAVIETAPPLPPVRWDAIGQQPPRLLGAHSGDLPSVAAVVVTWTAAEWAALEHVFCNGSVGMSYACRNRSNWDGWRIDDMGIPAASDWNHWGEYRLVEVRSSKVLLFKSNLHLDHPHGEQYLTSLIFRLISVAKPSIILSVGTAGGTHPADHIGTVKVARAATFFASGQPQSSWRKYSNPWRADWSLVGRPEFAKLLFPIPVTAGDLQSICDQFNSFYGSNYSLTDLNPGGLNRADSLPEIQDLTIVGTPVLTTDSFVIGTDSGNLAGFACVDMEDALIAAACTAGNIAFGSVRNISNPVQSAALPHDFQVRWAKAVYNSYGMYSSYNGAIAAWAILFAQLGKAKSNFR